MPELKEQEERLKFLLSKLNSETEKFEALQKAVEEKQQTLTNAITAKGLKEIPINISPHSEEQKNLVQEIQEHVMELNKLKNLISAKLDLVIKEEELIAGLKKKYGEKVEINKLPTEEFEINFKDEETESAYNQIKNSKKLLNQLRESLSELQTKERENQEE